MRTLKPNSTSALTGKPLLEIVYSKTKLEKIPRIEELLQGDV
jgi:hypothetical protein